MQNRFLTRRALFGFSFVLVTPLGPIHAHDNRLPDVAEQVVKSVVNISSFKKVNRKTESLEESFFRQFFDQGRRPQGDGMSQPSSLGSGVLVNKDGTILTNNHVVAGADKIRVLLSDGRDLEARVLGTDPDSDVAVLKLIGKHKKIQPIRIGNSDQLRLGETVVAVGNPFGVGQTGAR